MFFDYSAKDQSTKQANNVGGQAAQLKQSISNSSMANLLGNGGSLASARNILERNSGISLDDVNVHYNSKKPAEIGALSYAKGNDVFMGPGQEKYLGHELTHVVQQKQGIVQPTGRIGGMPANTSEELESAADHMSTEIPAAVGTGGTPAGGVVQGKFLRKETGKEISSGEVETVIGMLEGSYTEHMAEIDEISKANRKEMLEINHPERRQQQIVMDQRIRKIYKDRRSTVGKRFRKMMKSAELFIIEDAIKDEIYNAQLEAADRYGGSISYLMEGNLDMAGRRAINKDAKLAPRHTTEGFFSEISKFRLDNKILKGVDKIAEFDPEINKVEFLNERRKEGSHSLESGAIAKDQGVVIADKKTHEKMLRQFAKSTEIARKYAVEMRRSSKIDFEELYGLLTLLNKSLRKGQANGGNLRGVSVEAGDVNTVGPNQVPEDLYRLLNLIADYIHLIKKTENRSLQKSQVIKLAAFSYMMLVSIHPFPDGNGRTCRLFVDTILQIFGLPPVLPTELLTTKCVGTIAAEKPKDNEPVEDDGAPKERWMDYNQGANEYLTGILDSNEMIQKENQGHMMSKDSIANAYNKIRADKLQQSGKNVFINDGNFDNPFSSYMNKSEKRAVKPQRVNTKHLNLDKKAYKNDKEFQDFITLLEKYNNGGLLSVKVDLMKKASAYITKNSIGNKPKHKGRCAIMEDVIYQLIMDDGRAVVNANANYSRLKGVIEISNNSPNLSEEKKGTMKSNMENAMDEIQGFFMNKGNKYSKALQLTALNTMDMQNNTTRVKAGHKSESARDLMTRKNWISANVDQQNPVEILGTAFHEFNHMATGDSYNFSEIPFAFNKLESKDDAVDRLRKRNVFKEKFRHLGLKRELDIGDIIYFSGAKTEDFYIPKYKDYFGWVKGQHPDDQKLHKRLDSHAKDLEYAKYINEMVSNTNDPIKGKKGLDKAVEYDAVIPQMLAKYEASGRKKDTEAHRLLKAAAIDIVVDRYSALLKRKNPASFR